MLKKKEQLLVIDPLGEIGHLRFVNRTIEILSKDYDIVFVSSSTFCSRVVKASKYVDLNDVLFSYSGKYVFVIKQILILLYLYIKIIPSYRNTKVLFVGCENISFSLVWRNSKDTFLLLHNNIDKKGLSRYFFRRISRSVRLLVFENYILDYLKDIMKNKIFVVPHPLLKGAEMNKLEDNITYKNSILLLNVGGDSEYLDEILSFAEMNNMNAYIKSSADLSYISSNHVQVSDYIEDYYSLLFNSVAVFINAPYNYRISGVFIECMSMGKQIFFLNREGLYSQNMHQNYPSNVLNNLNMIQKNYSDTVNLIFKQLHSDENIFNCYQNVFLN